MKGERLERWRLLCAQAAEEQDPDKLMELVKEITFLLEEKEARLKEERIQGINGAENTNR